MACAPRRSGPPTVRPRSRLAPRPQISGAPSAPPRSWSSRCRRSPSSPARACGAGLDRVGPGDSTQRAARAGPRSAHPRPVAAPSRHRSASVGTLLSWAWLRPSMASSRSGCRGSCAWLGIAMIAPLIFAWLHACAMPLGERRRLEAGARHRVARRPALVITCGPGRRPTRPSRSCPCPSSLSRLRFGARRAGCGPADRLAIGAALAGTSPPGLRTPRRCIVPLLRWPPSSASCSPR
jgi:hypothetical protein